jgi:hypothetical protein
MIMEPSNNNRSSTRSVSERLTAATNELEALEKLIIAEESSPRVLGDFRDAVDNIRQTAFAVQQWTELRQQRRDPYTVLGRVAEERVRRATQINKDLTLDLESFELGLETAGLTALFHAVEGLHERLARMFNKTTI